MNLIFLCFAWNTNSLYFKFILDDFEFSRTGLMLTVTIGSVSNTIFSLLFGKILKKIGIRLLIIIGVACSSGSLLLYSVATNLIMFYIAAFFIGTSIAFVTTTTSAVLVNNWFAKHTGILLTITTTTSGLGGVIFPDIVTSWCTSLGWDMSFRYSAIVSLVAGIILIILVRIKPENKGLKPLWVSEAPETAAASPQEKEVPGVTTQEARKTKNLWCIFVLYFLLGMIIYSVQQTTALYSSTLGYEPVDVARIMQFLFLANMISQIPLGALSDKFSVRRVLPIGLIIFTVGLVLLIVPGITLGRMYIIAAIIGFSVVLISVMVPIVIREVFGLKDYAGILGLVIGVRTVGIAIGPPLLNLVFDLTGTYNPAFITYLAIMVLCIVLAIIGTRRIKLQNEAGATSVSVE
jgi:MFS family permease